jgi:hypothetical protein
VKRIVRGERAATSVARVGRPEKKKQTGCMLITRQGRKWQSREIKLKEFKHEDHIALGK